MESKSSTAVKKIGYIIIFVVASLPLACGYVMEGGDILIWLARIEEVKEHLQIKQMLMFPSAELVLEQGGQYTALYSNLWLLIPAVIRLLGGSVTVAYRVYMLFLNVIGILAAKKMFEQLFEDKVVALFGVLLYITCPYRNYIYYDKASLGMAAAWSLIPLVIWGMLKIWKASATWKSVMVTALAFAAVGYADGMLFLILAGILVLGIIWYKKLSGVIPFLIGGILFLPGAIYWLRYLIKGGMDVWNLPLQTIASEGYVFGQFFSSWVYRPNSPGLGLGLMMALLVLLWLAFTENQLMIMKKYGFFVFLMCLLAFMSLSCFPWDVVQRLGVPFLRMIALMQTPGLCFGFASLAAAVLGAYGVECVVKQKQLLVKVGLPVSIAFAALGGAVYLCNTLTYYRLPMFL